MEVARDFEIQQLRVRLSRTQTEVHILAGITVISTILSLSVSVWFRLVAYPALAGAWLWTYREITLTNRLAHLLHDKEELDNE